MIFDDIEALIITILWLSILFPGQPGWASTRRYISPSSGFSGAKWRQHRQMHQQSGWTATPSRLIGAPTSTIPSFTIFSTNLSMGRDSFWAPVKYNLNLVYRFLRTHLQVWPVDGYSRLWLKWRGVDSHKSIYVFWGFHWLLLPIQGVKSLPYVLLQKLKSDSGILKKKFSSLQKEMEEQREGVKKQQAEVTKLNAVIRDMEKDIVVLKKEISERDDTIQDKVCQQSTSSPFTSRILRIISDYNQLYCRRNRQWNITKFQIVQWQFFWQQADSQA